MLHCFKEMKEKYTVNFLMSQVGVYVVSQINHYLMSDLRQITHPFSLWLFIPSEIITWLEVTRLLSLLGNQMEYSIWNFFVNCKDVIGI